MWDKIVVFFICACVQLQIAAAQWFSKTLSDAWYSFITMRTIVPTYPGCLGCSRSCWGPPRRTRARWWRIWGQRRRGGGRCWRGGRWPSLWSSSQPVDLHTTLSCSSHLYELSTVKTSGWDLAELWMRYSRVARASDSQCRSRNFPAGSIPASSDTG